MFRHVTLGVLLRLCAWGALFLLLQWTLLMQQQNCFYCAPIRFGHKKTQRFQRKWFTFNNKCKTKLNKVIGDNTAILKTSNRVFFLQYYFQM